jgi:hypothetical protein
MYRAEKVQTENGPTWMIERDSLTNNPTPSAGQQVVVSPNTISAEAIQELARAIVREAGSTHDPAEEAAERRQRQFIEGGREHWKAQSDFFKHMATASGAGLVAVVAVIQLFAVGRSYEILYVISALFFVFSAIMSLGFLFAASSRLVMFSWGDVPPKDEASEHLTTSFLRARSTVYFLFGGGLSVLVGGLTESALLDFLFQSALVILQFPPA